MTNDLEWLLALQKDLVHEIDNRMKTNLYQTIDSGTDGEKIRWMYEMINALHNELEEVRNEFPWKSWKQYQGYDLKEKLPAIKEEVMDLLHFWLDMCLILGISSDEIRKGYAAKQQKNLDRQKNNY
jgi:NTP pyrophosphatase (non-canonical NTP hydrolase)